jgi:hypothetical protein
MMLGASFRGDFALSATISYALPAGALPSWSGRIRRARQGSEPDEGADPQPAERLAQLDVVDAVRPAPRRAVKPSA